MVLVLKSDGSSINKTVWNQIKKSALALVRNSLFQIGKYILHISHYAFLKDFSCRKDARKQKATEKVFPNGLTQARTNPSYAFISESRIS